MTKNGSDGIADRTTAVIDLLDADPEGTLSFAEELRRRGAEVLVVSGRGDEPELRRVLDACDPRWTVLVGGLPEGDVLSLRRVVPDRTRLVRLHTGETHTGDRFVEAILEPQQVLARIASLIRQSAATDEVPSGSPVERVVLPGGAGVPQAGSSEAASPSRPPAAPRSGRAEDAPPVVCTQPWVNMEIVDPNGRVSQCCSEWTVGHRGVVPRRSLLEIWNGPEYRAARRAMVHDVDALCRPICPRLGDRALAQETFRIEPGAPRFVENQRLLAQDIATGREQARGRPLQLALCPSTYCNYDCVMCTYGRTPRRDLPEEVWEEVEEMLPTLRHLSLLGGEPLASASTMRFLRRWDRAKYPDARVDVVTNGALLGRQTLEHLTRCRFGGVTVSLNAGTAEVYERVQRPTVPFETVIDNVDALREHRRRTDDSFGIALSFVVMPDNASSLLAFGRLAHERELPIRLLPLTLGGVEELDFYSDPEAVQSVLRHLEDLRAFAERVRPGWLPEVRGVESAIRGEATSRAAGGRRLPVIA